MFLKDIESGKIAHAYLFIGGREKDWDMLADLVKERENFLAPDIMVLSGKDSGEIKVEKVRELLHWLYLTPIGDRKLAIIKDCQYLNASSGNVLLKSLEEPPKSVTFLLFSGNNSVLPTIYSRCRTLRMPSDFEPEDQDVSVFDLNFAQVSKEMEKISKDDRLVDKLILALEHFYAQLLEKEKRQREVNFLWEIQKAKKRIQANVNPRLVLENLFLRLRR